MLDDLLGLMILAVLGSLAQGHLRYAELGATALFTLIFTIFVAVAGTRAMRQLAPRLAVLRAAHAEFAFALLLAFGLSLAAAQVGVAAIIGAFLAGMVLSEHTEGSEVRSLVRGATELLAPFFLVRLGLYFDPALLASAGVMGLAVALTLAAVLTKVAGCCLAARSLGRSDALRIGVGMVPRGSVGLVVVQIGLSLGVISDSTYAVSVVMVIATTLIVPPFLRRLFAEAGASVQSVPKV